MRWLEGFIGTMRGKSGNSLLHALAGYVVIALDSGGYKEVADIDLAEFLFFLWSHAAIRVGRYGLIVVRVETSWPKSADLKASSTGFSDFLATLRAVFFAVFFATNLVNLYIGKMERVPAA